MSRDIHKKTWSDLFEEILAGRKTFDLRLNDWDCQSGDFLVFDEIDKESKQPTGRSIRKKVGFILKTKDLSFFSESDVEKYGYQVISLLEDK
jgi:hypothetical protein